MSLPIEIDVILPTIDENENLTILVPELLGLKNVKLNQIIIVDDSNEDIQKRLTQISRDWPRNVKLLLRRGTNNSLASAIRSGAEVSASPYVVWMDADLSMPANLIEQLVLEVEGPKSVIIGSRFVEGGGFKGTSETSGKFSLNWMVKVRNSQDSILAVTLSRLLNSIIRFLIKGNVKDLTSGYILCSRDVALDLLPNDGYGEYCIEFLSSATNQGMKTTEIGYICLPRRHGYSKTGLTMAQLINTGFPYLLVALKNSKFLNFLRQRNGSVRNE